MIKRPISKQFNDAIWAGIKTTTIRKNPWPIDVPIMLFNWSGLPYRSKHVDVAAIQVLGTSPIDISHDFHGKVRYDRCVSPLDQLWRNEGFSSRDEMDDWFRKAIKPTRTAAMWLMRFERSNVKDQAP